MSSVTRRFFPSEFCPFSYRCCWASFLWRDLKIVDCVSFSCITCWVVRPQEMAVASLVNWIDNAVWCSAAWLHPYKIFVTIRSRCHALAPIFANYCFASSSLLFTHLYFQQILTTQPADNVYVMVTTFVLPMMVTTFAFMYLRLREDLSPTLLYRWEVASFSQANFRLYSSAQSSNIPICPYSVNYD